MTQSEVETPSAERLDYPDPRSSEDLVDLHDSESSLPDDENAAGTARGYMAIFRRITGVLGVLFLLAGLAVLKFHSGQHRLALLILVCAMFLSILHYYSLEGREGGEPGV